MSGTEFDLMRTIIEVPHDDGPRLVYCDWLYEHGQPEKAEFIQAGIRLYHMQQDKKSLAEDRVAVRNRMQELQNTQPNRQFYYHKDCVVRVQRGLPYAVYVTNWDFVYYLRHKPCGSCCMGRQKYVEREPFNFSIHNFGREITPDWPASSMEVKERQCPNCDGTGYNGMEFSPGSYASIGKMWPIVYVEYSEEYVHGLMFSHADPSDAANRISRCTVQPNWIVTDALYFNRQREPHTIWQRDVLSVSTVDMMRKHHGFRPLTRARQNAHRPTS